MVDFSGINLPFNVGDLLSSSMSILGLLGGFVLIGIVIYFVPIIIKLISICVGVYQDNKINEGSPRHQQSYSQSMKQYLFEEKFYRSKK